MARGPIMPLTLSALHIYPVKGLKGISLESARATDRGLEHDRRWMVVDRDGTFISQRSHPKMATVWTEIEGGNIVLSAPDVDSVELPLDIDEKGGLSATVWSSTVKAVPGPDAANRCLALQNLGYELDAQGKKVESAERYLAWIADD